MPPHGNHKQQYVKCTACGYKWSYWWKHRCHSCNAALSPAHSAPLRPTGAWAPGSAAQSAPAAGQKQQPAGGNGEHGGGDAGSGPARTPQQRIDSLVAARKELVVAGLDSSHDLVAGVDAKIEIAQQEALAGKPVWTQLRKHEGSLAKLRKQLARKKGDVENIQAQQEELALQLREAKSELAAMETKEEELVAQLEVHKQAQAAEPGAVDPAAKMVLEHMQLPASVLDSEVGRKTVDTIKGLLSNLLDLKQLASEEPPETQGATDEAAAAAAAKAAAEAAAQNGMAAPVGVGAADGSVDADMDGEYGGSAATRPESSDTFVDSLPESQKRLGTEFMEWRAKRTKQQHEAGLKAEGAQQQG